MKSIRRICILLPVILLLTSCSLVELFSPPEQGSEQLEESDDKVGDAEDILGGSQVTDSSDQTTDEVDIIIIGNTTEDDSVPAGAAVKTADSSSSEVDNRKPIKMEIKLFFADNNLIVEGKPGKYGFVTPVVRKIPAASGILKAVLTELIKGPLPEEKGLGPVIPSTVKVNKVAIKDKVAIIDFNEALITDHAGGTLGGSITQQAIIFTASQFDSVDGVLVTVEGEPWNDGHFIWDSPIYEEDLLKNYAK